MESNKNLSSKSNTNPKNVKESYKNGHKISLIERLRPQNSKTFPWKSPFSDRSIAANALLNGCSNAAAVL